MQSLDRALRVLEQLGEKGEPVSISELAEATQLPPSTVHRILQTFAKKDYVAHNPQTHLYHLGPAWIQIGAAAARMVNLSEVCRPVLTELMQATGEDAFLVVRVGRHGVAIERVEGPNTLKVVERRGWEMELHCGGIRRSLLAFLPEEEIEAYIAGGLEVYTDNTISDPDTLRATLAQIRRDGVGVSCGEYIPQAVGTGAPVFDARDRVVGSIGVVMPVFRATDEARAMVSAEVRRYAQKVSRLLGKR
ncbi:Transcriptional regulator, IclR family, C-terminal domain protein [uncultured delta proteobacterium]|uniref:Transcriptional regulator, IclR family, C-terminal domain protein n=1 Tax=uncultured delta proteobacterium TaxID=34034 RepID=A0A212K7T2_9DELT|nr:Transcriptional regulator, IclR family, C-terminal domain protein [uncultured delta proteobacterium]